MNWRELLQGAIRQGTYAKDAKAPLVAEDPGLLHLLHTDSSMSEKTDSSEQQPNREAIGRAGAVLASAGVRLMIVDGLTTVGIWSDLDRPGVRAALRTFGSDRLPVRYLDGTGVPMRYKVRRVKGEPVPMNVLAAMEQHPAEPWIVRDWMLKGMGGTRLSRRKNNGFRLLNPARPQTAGSLRHNGRLVKASPTILAVSLYCECSTSRPGCHFEAVSH